MSPSPSTSWRTRLAAVAISVTLVAGLVTAAYDLGMQAAPTGAAPTQLPREFQLLGEVYERIQAGAVDPPDDRTLFEGAVEGMLDTLDDPYAVFYDPEAFADFRETVVEGRFTGVGMVLEDTPEGLIVLSVLPDTPADRAGVDLGEQIVSVDGRDARDLPLEVVVDLVRGEEGTPVVIGLEGGPEGPRELEMVRERIDLPLVDSRLLDDGAGYVRLFQLAGGAATQLREAIDSLIDDGAQGIVLDLRGNPGGLLRESVDAASLFIEEGVIAYAKERVGEQEALNARGEALDVPLVVLVDRGSASGTEILAAAIKHHERGTLVGTRTFGKGTVQTITRLSDGSGLKITTASYFDPAGESLEGTGVLPDQVVDDEDEQMTTAQEILRDQFATLQR
jgi:carboxyl-terminal processing protease